LIYSSTDWGPRPCIGFPGFVSALPVIRLFTTVFPGVVPKVKQFLKHYLPFKYFSFFLNKVQKCVEIPEESGLYCFKLHFCFKNNYKNEILKKIVKILHY